MFLSRSDTDFFRPATSFSAATAPLLPTLVRHFSRAAVVSQTPSRSLARPRAAPTTTSHSPQPAGHHHHFRRTP